LIRVTAIGTAPASAGPPAHCDLLVVGAGILGLAVARELLSRRRGLRLTVLEREPEVGLHQTGHNSGVIHAGIYYKPGSLKAKLCVEGAHKLYEFCERRGVPYRRSGKVIVARDESELAPLDELESRGRANGVPGLRRITPEELATIEPQCRGVAALHSPFTGVVDFAAVARAFAEDVCDAGGELRTGRPVVGVRQAARAIELEHPDGATRARGAVFCAGPWADRLAVAAGAPTAPRIVPFRGAYLKLRPERASLVRTLIYPVPDPRLPFLGVHLSRHVDGVVTIGPTALIAGSRDARRRVKARDLGSTLAWPGTWRMARRWWRIGLTELRHALDTRALVRAAASYVPELRPADVEPAFAGVRAQALARDGTLLDDFVFSRTERALHVRNAPSPAATGALAISREIADRVERELL
jgi:L-2-hydroxyglutarate oxidase